MALTQLKTAAIADDAVTEDKLANAINTARTANTAKTTNATHTGDVTGSGSLTIADNAVTLAKMAGGTDGQIITYDASGDPVAVGPGTDGQVLTSAGAGSPPAFEAIPASGRSHNLVINGDMRIAQRGTSSTSAGYQTVDRINPSFGGTDEAPTFAQADVASGTPAYQAGFRKCFKVTNGNQTSGADAGDHIQIDYYIEAQDLANSGWDYTSTSSYVTLSFWMKSSVSQAFPATFQTQDGTQQVYNMTTGTLSANTWTKVSKTIPGDSNLQFDNDTNRGCRLMFFPHIGTTYTTTGLAMDTWSAWTNPKHSFDMATTWWTTNDATWEITGLQLEVGNTASDYPHESYGENLARCQRYYHSVSQAVWNNIVYQNHYFPTTMRANPTITSTSTGPNATRKNNWYGKKSSGGIEGGVSFDWTASAEL